MKKTLAVAAVLAAFAGSAFADVTVYGKVDMGAVWQHADGADKFGMASGQSSGNRFGFKGSEKISDGLTVGFQLEQGFDADTGEFAGATRAFHRESRLYVATDYGTLHMGRMGSLDSGTGSVNLSSKWTAFGTGFGDDYVLGSQSGILNTDTRRNNTIVYQSPKMAGVTAYAQASLGDKNDADEGKAGQTRYYAAAATYAAGAFDGGLVVSRQDGKAGEATEDSVTAGFGYNFGVAKVMLAANYTEQGEDADRYGVVLSATAPVAGGNLLVAAGYSEKTAWYNGADKTNGDSEVLMAAVAYTYPLSKQTNLYVGLGYDEEKFDTTREDKITGMFGVCHSF